MKVSPFHAELRPAESADGVGDQQRRGTVSYDGEGRRVKKVLRRVEGALTKRLVTLDQVKRIPKIVEQGRRLLEKLGGK